MCYVNSNLNLDEYKHYVSLLTNYEKVNTIDYVYPPM